VRQKVESVQQREKKDKFAKVNVTESPDGKEFIVDYFISEAPENGDSYIEYNIYRFKNMENGGQKSFLIMSYAKRMYGDLKSATKALAKQRDHLMTTMIEYKIPKIKIAESTPGPIAVNAATFIGSKIDGFFGALFATLGVVLPSFITILAVSFAIAQFEHIKLVQYAFTGIRAAVLALIIRALAAMYKECPKSPLSYIIAAAAFFVAAFTSINTIFIILGCAAVGLAVHLVFNTKNGKAGEGK
jgi:chromate transport protein ChrA